MLLIKSTSQDILIKNGKIAEIADTITVTADMTVIDAAGLIVAPGLVDIHVHFREPGFEYKEDILSGAAAAATGGITTCCCMANTKPVADSKEITEQITRKASSALVKVLPVCAVTHGLQGTTLTDFVLLKSAGAIALSDDGIPIINDDVMREALITADKNGMLIISHCEEEEPMVKRDIELASETGTRIHIAHVSTADAVESIRKAKAAGIKVTAETCPHYFSLTESTVDEKGTLAKMSPPLRKQRDVEAIILGLCDGTIDAIATDHAPHSVEEKALPFNDAPNGIIGLETSLAVTLTYLYHTGKMNIKEILQLMAENPAKILGINAGILKEGSPADITIFDPDKEWIIEPEKFKSKARNTPYGGMKLRGKVILTICGGKVVYNSENIDLMMN